MRILVVVDYQRDFVDGSLGSYHAVAIEDAICSRISEYEDVVFTMDTHSSDYLDTMEGRLLPVEHCIEDTEGWELYGKVRGLSEGHVLLRKDTFGCSQLLDILKDYDEIELCGVATNICVIANAVIARTANPQARIIVREDCVASYDQDAGRKALDVMESLQIEVIRVGCP